jgi:hypothetical protein
MGKFFANPRLARYIRVKVKTRQEETGLIHRTTDLNV